MVRRNSNWKRGAPWVPISIGAVSLAVSTLTVGQRKHKLRTNTNYTKQRTCEDGEHCTALHRTVLAIFLQSSSTFKIIVILGQFALFQSCCIVSVIPRNNHTQEQSFAIYEFNSSQQLSLSYFQKDNRWLNCFLAIKISVQNQQYFFLNINHPAKAWVQR